MWVSLTSLTLALCLSVSLVLFLSLYLLLCFSLSPFFRFCSFSLHFSPLFFSLSFSTYTYIYTHTSMHTAHMHTKHHTPDTRTHAHCTHAHQTQHNRHAHTHTCTPHTCTPNTTHQTRTHQTHAHMHTAHMHTKHHTIDMHTCTPHTCKPHTTHQTHTQIYKTLNISLEGSLPATRWLTGFVGLWSRGRRVWTLIENSHVHTVFLPFFTGCWTNLPVYNKSHCLELGLFVEANGTCYSPTGHLVAIYDEPLARFFNIKKMLPSTEFFQYVQCQQFV